MNPKKAKVIEAAEAVFFRYGFRRATMGDLAAAAGMSRPALYLLFCSKEQVFEAVLRAFTARALDEVRAGLPDRTGPLEKLRFAFEVWAVRPFHLFMAAPDARELVDCSFAFAQEAVEQSYRAFEAELAAILAPVAAQAPPQLLSPDQIAHILTRAVHGFKESATGLEDLRAMIDGLLTMVLAPMTPEQT